MLPHLRSELSAELERDLRVAADRRRLIAAAAQRPSIDSPRRRPVRRLAFFAQAIVAGPSGIPFEVNQR